VLPVPVQRRCAPSVTARNGRNHAWRFFLDVQIISSFVVPPN
jgi:hypothetical protein